MWNATFRLASEEEVRIFEEFLKAHLRTSNKFSASEKNVIIESPSENECFVAAHWAKNRNPLGPRLYSVKGFDEQGKVIFDSGCPVCRKQKEAVGERNAHWQHKAYRKKPASPIPVGERCEVLSMVKVGAEGRIRLTSRVLRKLGARRGQTIAFILEKGKVVVQKETQRSLF